MLFISNKQQKGNGSIYKNLVVDAVIIATPDRTHCQVATEWIGRARCIFFEKPLDSTIANIEAFESDLRRHGGEIFPLAFDHYRTKALPLRNMMRPALGWLGGSPSSFKFYLLEQETIEDESRTETLNQGLMLDLLPHCLSLLLFFADPSTFRVTDLKVGRYEGARIERETFAAVNFTIKTHGGEHSEGTAFVGKGVGGVRNLYRAGQIIQCGTTKLFEIEGRNGRRIRLDFLKGSNAFMIEQGEREQLVAGLVDAPHAQLVEAFITDQLPSNHSCFSIEAAKSIVDKIADIGKRVPNAIPEYQTTDYLEDILEKVGWSESYHVAGKP